MCKFIYFSGSSSNGIGVINLSRASKMSSGMLDHSLQYLGAYFCGHYIHSIIETNLLSYFARSVHKIVLYFCSIIGGCFSFSLSLTVKSRQKV